MSQFLSIQRNKIFILLRWALRQFSTLPRRCQGCFQRIREKLPVRKRGKYLRSAKHNELGWPVQEVSDA